MCQRGFGRFRNRAIRLITDRPSSVLQADAFLGRGVALYYLYVGRFDDIPSVAPLR